MAKRKTIGKNPLDALLPPIPTTPKPSEPQVARTTSGVSPKMTADPVDMKTKTPKRANPTSVKKTPEKEAPKPMKQLADQTQYLTFRLTGEEYAIGILQVKEVVSYDTLTRVPKTPASIRGLINLRGIALPVVDPAVKFGLPEIIITKETCIVIVEVERDGGKTVMGVMADAVSDVLDLRPEDIVPVPHLGTDVQVDYLRALGRVGNGFVLILDIDRLLLAEDVMATALTRDTARKELRTASGDISQRLEAELIPNVGAPLSGEAAP